MLVETIEKPMEEYTVNLLEKEIPSHKKAKIFIDLKDFIMGPYRSKMKAFTPKIRFKIEKGNFLIKTIENADEMEHALKLRHEVFYEELLHRKLLIGLDVDQFDFCCDHLIVIDTKMRKLIGTYRVNSSLFTKNFYSETEFALDNIKKLEGNKMELGRACIHKDYRNGMTITLLWEAISEYVAQTESRYLFGCSSIKTTKRNEIALVLKYMKDFFYAEENLRVYPKMRYKVFKIDSLANSLDKNKIKYSPVTARKLVPSLLNSYLRAGAKVCGEPALDRAFKCIDFLTILDTDNIKKSVEKKFNLCGS
jgi:putative hemolysin